MDDPLVLISGEPTRHGRGAGMRGNMEPLAEYSELRKFPRLGEQVEVSVARLGSGDETALAAVARDISGGGMCFSSEHSHPRQTRLFLTIHIRDWGLYQDPPVLLVNGMNRASLSALAEVKWEKRAANGKYWTGVRFLDISEKDYKALRRFLDRMDRDLEKAGEPD